MKNQTQCDHQCILYFRKVFNFYCNFLVEFYAWNSKCILVFFILWVWTILLSHLALYSIFFFNAGSKKSLPPQHWWRGAIVCLVIYVLFLCPHPMKRCSAYAPTSPACPLLHPAALCLAWLYISSGRELVTKDSPVWSVFTFFHQCCNNTGCEVKCLRTQSVGMMIPSHENRFVALNSLKFGQ